MILNIKDLWEQFSLDCKNCKIIAVTKGRSLEQIKKAYEVGVRNFGENYVQEFLQKYEQLKEYDINWHFIGRLQSNKI